MTLRPAFHVQTLFGMSNINSKLTSVDRSIYAREHNMTEQRKQQSRAPVGIAGRPLQTSQPPAGLPVQVPSIRYQQQRPFTEISSSEKSGDGEFVKIPDFQHDNTYLSPAEAEKALRELVSGGMNQELDSNIDIDISQEIVDGFKEGIRLLPHQILGRAWMRDREDLTKKRTGGILADDMGYRLFIPPKISLRYFVVLERRYRP